MRYKKTQINNTKKSEKAIQDINEKFTKEIGIIKKNQTKILKLRNLLNQIKNTFSLQQEIRSNRRKKIIQLEDRSFENSQIRQK